MNEPERCFTAGKHAGRFIPVVDHFRASRVGVFHSVFPRYYEHQRIVQAPRSLVQQPQSEAIAALDADLLGQLSSRLGRLLAYCADWRIVCKRLRPLNRCKGGEAFCNKRLY